MKRNLLSLLCLFVVQAVLVLPVVTEAVPNPPQSEPLALAGGPTLSYASTLAEEESSIFRGEFAFPAHPRATTVKRALDSSWWIENIADFLDKCPTQDLAYAQIRDDFKIRRNGILVENVPCSEPISQMPVSEYTDELITLQALRLTYYMDLGQSIHLPWTTLTLYDWLRSKIAGINVSDTAGFNYCCEEYPEGWYIVVRTQPDDQREFDREWRGLSGQLALLMHEARHMDGYLHVSCCGITNGCDQNYDETDLTTYGIQWWLNSNWYSGDLYVGFSCLDPDELYDISMWHASACEGFRNRFCDTKPPDTPWPIDQPGGPCRPAPQPLVRFASSSPDWLGETTVFTNTSLTGDTVTYNWSFGDGTTSNQKDPTHTYAQPGHHTVTIIASSPTGSVTSTDTVTLYGPPSAHFVAHPTDGARPLKVAFTDKTTTTPSGDPSLTYLWQFGDGETSHQPNPTHTYLESGTYTITLTVNNAAGSDEKTKEKYITVRDVHKCLLPLVLRNRP